MVRAGSSSSGLTSVGASKDFYSTIETTSFGFEQCEYVICSHHPKVSTARNILE
jgi:hypothetical protein